MGWTGIDSFYCAHDSKGNIDRKHTIDREFTRFDDKYKMIKSVMVGSVHYSAWRNDETGEVSAMVTLTSVSDGWLNYKEMSETMLPYEAKCPVSILKLLTGTDNECANKWRQRCIEHSKKPSLSKIPVGSRIRYTRHDGRVMVLTKQPSNHQFKTTWYLHNESGCYVPKKHIPDDFEVLA